MIFVKINNQNYPATVNGRMNDDTWDNRESREITLEMDYTTASKLFVDGQQWSIVQQNEVDGEIQETEWDNSEFNIAGDITDHRDGTITVKMGKETDIERLVLRLYA